jgi:hypothetical protein
MSYGPGVKDGPGVSDGPGVKDGPGVGEGPGVGVGVCVGVGACKIVTSMGDGAIDSLVRVSCKDMTLGATWYIP